MTFTNDKTQIRCADCLHCKVFKDSEPSGRYVLRVRCDKQNWVRGKNGRIKATYHLHTLMGRRMDACPDYDSLSEGEDDRDAYLRALAEDLPVEKYVYNPDGSFVDIEERA